MSIHELEGKCHCGNVKVHFKTPTPLETLSVRECQCSFCRKHGARTMTDPLGHLTLEVTDSGKLNRYRFGLSSADFLVCAECGIYVAALLEHERGAYATLNTNTIEGFKFDATAPSPVDYEAESAGERTSRRLRRWTPTTVEIAD